ncbi:MerR family transcriptional regulator [Streptomyces genisteinicus]|uniref:MerR family transcriptional regulator n=1 Tax=Streptomyces genisteinicus TaxID=2768068 RepID=A0A7H0HLV8_9ACTN|nr:MerR family transcriptional regulator [Streptomyces genisteinicus]QNP61524.1 MerR family transcriptional regulator [Streptomyces genisteinicus]
MPDGRWSIGELAARAGATVKTVRFYSDRGLLPEAGRSAGGHRRYGPEALERLGLIRSLRGLGLPVTEVARVLDPEEDVPGRTLEDAVAGQLREVGSQLTALRWRDAALRLVGDSPPGERAERLRLVGAVASPPSTASLARFWRRWLPPRLPARVVAEVVDHAVPPPPDDPTPAEVLAFARLHALVSGPCTGGVPCQPTAHRSDGGYRASVVYEGLPEAYALAASELLARRSPGPGPALDCFVAVYAAACGERSTPAFRRRLGGQLAADPRIDLYWQQAAVLFGPSAPTPGAAHDWLCAALDAETERVGAA